MHAIVKSSFEASAKAFTAILRQKGEARESDFDMTSKIIDL